MKSIRIAHISDPHFAAITYNLNQFFSKRWLGNCNLILFRHKTYQTDHLCHLPALFASLKVDLVAITGDLTTTSLDKEFVKAKEFVDSFARHGMRTTLLPGNHDIYTKESERHHRFYKYFPGEALEGNIEVQEIKPGIWWVGLHCAYASSLILSNGKFTPAMGERLEKVLSTLPSKDMIIIGNHFPLFTTGNLRHDLLGAKRLQEILRRFPNIKIYLHGHDHTHYVIDRQNEGFPLVLNSGSLSHLPRGNFYILDLSPEHCLWQRYTLEEKNHWILAEKIKILMKF